MAHRPEQVTAPGQLLHPPAAQALGQFGSDTGCPTPHLFFSPVSEGKVEEILGYGTKESVHSR